MAKGLAEMLLDPNKLTAVEFRFLQTYVAAMRRDYDQLTAVLGLMDPARLDVKCVVTATRLANKLRGLRADFEAGLQQVQAKHKLGTKASPAHPTSEELADLFTMSFFKVVVPTPKGKADNGLFSGEPAEWKNTLIQHTNKAPKKHPLQDALSAYLSAMLKLFPNLPPQNSSNKDWKDFFALPPNSFYAYDDDMQNDWTDDWGDDDDDEDDDWPENFK